MWPFTDSYPVVSAKEVDGKTFDYIIVGGGTAGCVLASRLSEDPSVSVLVLEKGGVKDNWWTRIPLISQNFRLPGMQAVVRHSEPVAHHDGAKIELWSAEGLGGTTRINGMLLTRGMPGGYNMWARQYGLADWSWDKVEPYFRKSENAVGRPGATYRGHDGPIESRPATDVVGSAAYFESSAQALGLPALPDLNDPAASAQGCFDLDQTISASGVRLSAYRIWLNSRIASERRSNLSVCTGVVASSLELNEKADRVMAVRIRPVLSTHALQHYSARARREVIVCSGAMCTPQLLMISGIGPKDQLEPLGIPIRRENDSVGRNLSDHVAVPIMTEIQTKDTLHILETLFGILWNFFLWLFFGRGLLASSSTPKSIFLNTRAIDKSTMTVKSVDSEGNDTMDPSQPRNTPDVEIMLNPINCLIKEIPRVPLFSWYTALTQPFSRGRVQIVSTDARVHPTVQHPMLIDERDRTAMHTAVRFSMRLADEFEKQYPHPAPLTFAPGMDLDYLDSVHAGTIKPKPAPSIPTPVPGGKLPLDDAASTSSEREVAHKQQALLYTKTWNTATDDDISEYVKRTGQSSLHYTSTCRMSLDPKEGVVDQRLRVHGFANLRIADASVFPHIPSAHTMAPTVMVAERCADFLKEEWADKKTK